VRWALESHYSMKHRGHITVLVQYNEVATAATPSAPVTVLLLESLICSLGWQP
jgi:hypothetical protein